MTDTTDLEVDVDRTAIATSLVRDAQRKNKSAPAVLDLTTAITKITFDDTVSGSSTLTITLTDPNLVITTSGFLDPNDDGKLDKLELNYPDGSDLWWMLSSISVAAYETVQLTFMERTAVWLQQFRGPKKASRASQTRAEFIKSLVDEMKQDVTFHCSELNTPQALAITPPTDPGKTVKGRKVTKTGKSATKGAGLNEQVKLVLTGPDGGTHRMTKEETANATVVLDTALSITTKPYAILALLCACIVEGPFFANPIGGDASSSGILQLLADKLGGSTSTTGGRRDIALVCNLFLQKGFAGNGGAVSIAGTINDGSKIHPYKVAPTGKPFTPGEIAQAVQGSNFPDRYQKVIDAAQQVWTAYGAGSLSPGGTTTAGKTKTNYHFQVGNSANPHETYWDAINRLAQEVKWDFFVDGADVYYDAETTLIRQKPILYLERLDAAVMDWSYDWDSRQIATEMQLMLLCEQFEFSAGQVIQLDPDWGPVGAGSNVALPGRWLITSITRDSDSWVSTLTLRQPTYPGPEPTTQTTDVPDAGVGDKTTAGKAYAEAIKIDARNLSYGNGGHGDDWSAAEQASTLDCSSSTSLCLHAAGLMGGVPGPQVSSWFLTWGESGQGKNMTVWVKPGIGAQGHVWIQFHGRKAWRFDTSPWGSGGLGPHLRYTARDTTGFVARRFPGDV